MYPLKQLNRNYKGHMPQHLYLCEHSQSKKVTVYSDSLGNT